MSGQGPMTGRVLSGRYEIGERIGIGGMAEVYSAHDTTLGRTVAVKVMLPQYAEDPDFARRFRQEAAAVANLQSPYIVNIYDWGQQDGTYFIVMEYVRGSDLKTAILQRGAINQRKAAEIAAQVCQALSVAHAQDIIHRDIKPQNIMVQPDGNVKVMDFGIARAKNSTADKTQTVLGTAHYASPEQAQGHDLTATSDIYSLGVVLYESVTGTLPFDGPDAVSVALMQVQDIPPAPRELNPDIDPSLESIILRAMEKDPHLRFATANDMRLALNDYLAGRPVGMGGGAGLTSAQTSVIAPIGAPAGNMIDSTQVMPVTQVGSATRTQPIRYNSAHGREEEETGSKKKVGIVVGVIAAIVVVALACFFLFAPGGEKIDVPNVVGMTTEEAITAIEDAGFEVGKTESAHDDSVESGKVISQNPKGGSKAAKGSKIDILVSQGTEEVNVPKIEGLTQEEATRTLLREGFVVGEVTNEYSDSVESGKVMTQTPAANTKALKGSSVNIVISQGKEQGSIPDIEGKSVDAARSAAESAGFTISENGSEHSDSVPAGCIIRQFPKAGTKADKGTAITYVVSIGKEDTGVNVPNVVGYSVENAQSTLSNSGFSVYIQSEKSSSPSGTVIRQSPNGGSKANKGTTVTIVVSEGSGVQPDEGE